MNKSSFARLYTGFAMRPCSTTIGEHNRTNVRMRTAGKHYHIISKNTNIAITAAQMSSDPEDAMLLRTIESYSAGMQMMSTKALLHNGSITKQSSFHTCYIQHQHHKCHQVMLHHECLYLKMRRYLWRK